MRRDGAGWTNKWFFLARFGRRLVRFLEPEAHKKFLRIAEPPKDFENFSMAIFAPAPLESVLVLLECAWECSWKSLLVLQPEST